MVSETTLCICALFSKLDHGGRENGSVNGQENHYTTTEWLNQ